MTMLVLLRCNGLLVDTMQYGLMVPFTGQTQLSKAIIREEKEANYEFITLKIKVPLTLRFVF